MSTEPPGRWRRFLGPIKLAIFVLVVCGIAWFVWRAREDFLAHKFSIFDVDPRWLGLAGLFYLVGMLPCGLYWHRVLLAMGQRPTLSTTLRAYYIGHLGKYVPLKLTVVAMRTVMIQGTRVDATVAAVSIFFETLTMMAVGALLAGLILAAWFGRHWSLIALAVGLMVLAGLPALPPVFRRLVRLLNVARASPQIDEMLSRIGYRLVLSGWLGIAAGWCVLGLSLWATLRGMPGVGPKLGGPLEELPLLTASVCLALVAGFLSLLPGGMGVRELVLIPLMQQHLEISTKDAIIAAVLLRVVWLVSELTLSGILFLCGRGRTGGERPDRLAGGTPDIQHDAVTD